MVEDIRKDSGLIGLIQPDHDSDDQDPNAALTRVGTAAIVNDIKDAEPKGCFHITITGICRFQITSEIETETSYRQANVDLLPFENDLIEPSDAEVATIDRQSLITTLLCLLDANGTSANPERLDTMRSEHLLNLAMIISPFSPREKQALIETPTLIDQYALFTKMLTMTLATPMSGHTGRIH